ncbi:MAG: DUF551 domain-containing protein [Bacteroidaceae bacterium]|nr:DUF551 domain-containing protein [Bacteroidaceae bacterium]
MDVREKLVELVKSAIIDWEHGDVSEWIADNLISNGVTVQEWISVKDRLPKPFVSVLVHMPGEEPFPTVREGFISNDGIWQSAMFRREPGEVTHWQLMPQPPKGE